MKHLQIAPHLVADGVSSNVILLLCMFIACDECCVLHFALVLLHISIPLPFLVTVKAGLALLSE